MKRLFFSTTQEANAKRRSAEWIVEAPSLGGVLTLANFGTVQFTDASATLKGHSGSISDAACQHDAITMVRPDGTIKAEPSALSSNGASFKVDWRNH